MSDVLPFGLGLVMGLVIVWPVLALVVAFRLFSFPDLTVEGSTALGAAVFATLLQAGQPLVIAAGGAVAAGALLGAGTAAIHSWLNLNKFLAGIIVVAISYTLCLRVMKAPNIGLLSRESPFTAFEPLDRAAPGLQLGTLLALVLALSVALVVLWLLLRSAWGLRLRTVGSNPEYGRALGLRNEWYLVGGLALTNALAAFGGFVAASYQGFADVSMGQGMLIVALASMTLGERLAPQRSLSIPVYALVAGVLGAVIYQIVVAYALHLGLAPTDLKLATAVFVLAVVALRLRRKDDAFSESLQ